MMAWPSNAAGFSFPALPLHPADQPSFWRSWDARPPTPSLSEATAAATGSRCPSRPPSYSSAVAMTYPHAAAASSFPVSGGQLRLLPLAHHAPYALPALAHHHHHHHHDAAHHPRHHAAAGVLTGPFSSTSLPHLAGATMYHQYAAAAAGCGVGAEGLLPVASYNMDYSKAMDYNRMTAAPSTPSAASPWGYATAMHIGSYEHGRSHFTDFEQGRGHIMGYGHVPAGYGFEHASALVPGYERALQHAMDYERPPEHGSTDYEHAPAQRSLRVCSDESEPMDLSPPSTDSPGSVTEPSSPGRSSTGTPDCFSGSSEDVDVVSFEDQESGSDGHRSSSSGYASPVAADAAQDKDKLASLSACNMDAAPADTAQVSDRGEDHLASLPGCRKDDAPVNTDSGATMNSSGISSTGSSGATAGSSGPSKDSSAITTNSSEIITASSGAATDSSGSTTASSGATADSSGAATDSAFGSTTASSGAATDSSSSNSAKKEVAADDNDEDDAAVKPAHSLECSVCEQQSADPAVIKAPPRVHVRYFPFTVPEAGVEQQQQESTVTTDHRSKRAVPAKPHKQQQSVQAAAAPPVKRHKHVVDALFAANGLSRNAVVVCCCRAAGRPRGRTLGRPQGGRGAGSAAGRGTTRRASTSPCRTCASRLFAEEDDDDVKAAAPSPPPPPPPPQPLTSSLSHDSLVDGNLAEAVDYLHRPGDGARGSDAGVRRKFARIGPSNALGVGRAVRAAAAAARSITATMLSPQPDEEEQQHQERGAEDEDVDLIEEEPSSPQKRLKLRGGGADGQQEEVAAGASVKWEQVGRFPPPPSPPPPVLVKEESDDCREMPTLGSFHEVHPGWWRMEGIDLDAGKTTTGGPVLQAVYSLATAQGGHSEEEEAAAAGVQIKQERDGVGRSAGADTGRASESQGAGDAAHNPTAMKEEVEVKEEQAVPVQEDSDEDWVPHREYLGGSAGGSSGESSERRAGGSGGRSAGRSVRGGGQGGGGGGRGSVLDEERPYHCATCGNGFLYSSTLKTHELIHTGEKPYPCTVCGKRFRDGSNRKRHIQTHHLKEKPHKCDVCKARFSLASVLKTHSHLHTGAKPFECEVCGKRFRASANLCKHKRVHTGEKPYSCTVCEKRFADPSTRKCHERTHSNERPFGCEQCGKWYKQHSGLRAHRRSSTGCQKL